MSFIINEIDASSAEEARTKSELVRYDKLSHYQPTFNSVLYIYSNVGEHKESIIGAVA